MIWPWLILAAAALAFLATRGAGVPESVAAIARAIAAEEGWGGTEPDGSPNRPTRNNNPGDLRDWPAGYPRDAGGFTIFPSSAEGWDALYRDISAHLERNPAQSITDWIASYAEVAGADLKRYAGAVAAAVGLTPDAPLGAIGAITNG